jgi:hypothetical protein
MQNSNFDQKVTSLSYKDFESFFHLVTKRFNAKFGWDKSRESIKKTIILYIK